ncbi:hypothetical protein P8C59_007546 [Phyllachora maydis]|uniref:Uncharacterized protein n=1 Tax=Phyllachora maydis TaxID=1825666 RepID=A0AAD9I9S3_9PEZI|nr:hypothetical protein P8C59_007546 [Phyllachora maydis]
MAVPSGGQRPLSPNLAHSYAPELSTIEGLHHVPPEAYGFGHDMPQVAGTLQMPGPDGTSHSTDKYIAHQPSSNHHLPSSMPPGAASPPVEKQPPEKKRILGLPVTGFWTLVGLAVLIILGVALGAGLGVGLSRSNSSKDASVPSASPATNLPGFTSQSTATATSAPVTAAPGTSTTAPSSSVTPSPASSSSTSPTSSAPVTSGTTGLAANSCTFTTPKTVSAADGTKFTEYCFTDWPNGVAAADGNGNVTDIARTTVYTFEECMAYCASYNAQISGGGTKCQAITYNSNLTDIIAVGKQGGDCFLKDKKGIDLQGSAESACAAIVY